MNFKYDKTLPHVAIGVRSALSDIHASLLGDTYASGNLAGFSISDEAEAQRFCVLSASLGLTDCQVGLNEVLPPSYGSTIFRFGSCIFIGPMPERDLPGHVSDKPILERRQHALSGASQARGQG